MRAEGLAWLGTRTPRFEETFGFFGGTLGLSVERREPDFAVLKMPNGDTVEVFGPGDRDHTHFTTGPVAGFRVADVAAARRAGSDRGLLYRAGAHGRGRRVVVAPRRPRRQRPRDHRRPQRPTHGVRTPPC